MGRQPATNNKQQLDRTTSRQNYMKENGNWTVWRADGSRRRGVGVKRQERIKSVQFVLKKLDSSNDVLYSGN